MANREPIYTIDAPLTSDSEATDDMQVDTPASCFSSFTSQSSSSTSSLDDTSPSPGSTARLEVPSFADATLANDDALAEPNFTDVHSEDALYNTLPVDQFNTIHHFQDTSNVFFSDDVDDANFLRGIDTFSNSELGLYPDPLGLLLNEDMPPVGGIDHHTLLLTTLFLTALMFPATSPIPSTLLLPTTLMTSRLYPLLCSPFSRPML